MSAVKIEQIPPGVIADYAGVTAPDGWLLCFGQEISRTSFAALFAAISTIYGVGNGSSTFNLPDCRGRVIAAPDNMGGVAAGRLGGGVTGGVSSGALAATGGEYYHVLTQAEEPPHSHIAPSHVHNNPAHQHYTGTTHTHYTPAYVAGSYVANSGAGANYTVLINPSANPNTSGVAPGWSDAGYGATQGDAGNSANWCQNTGGGNLHNNVQPTIILNKIIHI